MDATGIKGLHTEHLGQRFLWFERLGSTNDYLKEHGETLPDGTVVAAAEQVAGKGRRGNQWTVPRGESVSMSALFHNLGEQMLPLLPLVCGLAAAKGLSGLTGQKARIKWPNDVVINQKKLVGILCESVLGTGNSLAVCGIGINVLQKQAYFDEAGLPYATSLYLQTQVLYSLDEAAAAVLNQLEPLMELLRQKGFSALREEYEQFSATLGRPVRILQDGEQKEGVALGIGEDGSLLCNIGGALVPVRSGEASVRGLYGYL